MSGKSKQVSYYSLLRLQLRWFPEKERSLHYWKVKSENFACTSDGSQKRDLCFVGKSNLGQFTMFLNLLEPVSIQM